MSKRILLVLVVVAVSFFAGYEFSVYVSNSPSNRPNTDPDSGEASESASSESDFPTEGYPDFTMNPIDKDYEREEKILGESMNYSTLGHIQLEDKYALLWDIELNAIYNKLLAVLEKEEQDLLREAQTGWVQLHQKESEFYYRVFYERSSGQLLGSLGRIEAVFYHKERIRQRTLELMVHYYRLGYEIDFEYELAS
jgi:uncharacterized protein YecT (DUF1311 family)